MTGGGGAGTGGWYNISPEFEYISATQSSSSNKTLLVLLGEMAEELRAAVLLLSKRLNSCLASSGP